MILAISFLIALADNSALHAGVFFMMRDDICNRLDRESYKLLPNSSKLWLGCILGGRGLFVCARKAFVAIMRVIHIGSFNGVDM